MTLLRMCLRVKKILFAIGLGMQALVYLSASNFEDVIKNILFYYYFQNYEVINKKVDCKTITDLISKGTDQK